MKQYESLLVELYNSRNDDNYETKLKQFNLAHQIWEECYDDCKDNEPRGTIKVFEMKRIAELHNYSYNEAKHIGLNWHLLSVLFPKATTITIPVNKLFPILNHLDGNNKRYGEHVYLIKLDLYNNDMYYHIRFMFDQVFIVRYKDNSIMY